MPSLAKALSSTSLGKLPVWPAMSGAGVGEIFDVMVLVAVAAAAMGAVATRRVKKCIVEFAGVSYCISACSKAKPGFVAIPQYLVVYGRVLEMTREC
jgi:hypothetical protein